MFRILKQITGFRNGLRFKPYAICHTKDPARWPLDPLFYLNLLDSSGRVRPPNNHANGTVHSSAVQGNIIGLGSPGFSNYKTLMVNHWHESVCDMLNVLKAGAITRLLS